MNTPSTNAAKPRSGRALFFLGIALGVLGPIAYIVEVQSGRLATPWYLPILGITAVLLTFASWLRGRGIARLLVSLALILPASAETLLVGISKLPDYAGPVAVDRPFPPFATKLASGAAFTQADLKGNEATAMIFFRGRW